MSWQKAKTTEPITAFCCLYIYIFVCIVKSQLYIYIYIYIFVCVCVYYCGCVSLNKSFDSFHTMIQTNAHLYHILLNELGPLSC